MKKKLDSLYNMLQDPEYSQKMAKRLLDQSTKFETDECFWEPKEHDTKGAFAIIRFLPNQNLHGDNALEVKKHFFQADDGSWFVEPCPQNVGKECPVCKASRFLYKKGEKQLAGRRRASTLYISNILIVKDPMEPENEGKIFLYEYQKTMFDKINEKANPLNDVEEPGEPFNPIRGVDFILKMTRQPGVPGTKGKRDFSLSGFKSEKRAIATTEEEVNELWNKLYHLEDAVFTTKKYSIRTYSSLCDLLKQKDGTTSPIIPEGSPIPEPGATIPAQPAVVIPAETPKEESVAEETKIADTDIEDIELDLSSLDKKNDEMLEPGAEEKTEPLPAPKEKKEEPAKTEEKPIASPDDIDEMFGK